MKEDPEGRIREGRRWSPHCNWYMGLKGVKRLLKAKDDKSTPPLCLSGKVGAKQTRRTGEEKARRGLSQRAKGTSSNTPRSGLTFWGSGLEKKKNRRAKRKNTTKRGKKRRIGFVFGLRGCGKGGL